MQIAGGDHYFVSTHYRAVVDVVREQLVGLMAGGLMEGHSWIDEKTSAEVHRWLLMYDVMTALPLSVVGVSESIASLHTSQSAGIRVCRDHAPASTKRWAHK